MERSIPNRGLDRLDVLVGDWEMEAIVGGQTVRGARTTFEWTQGGAFLAQHADLVPTDAPPPPPEWVANSPFPLTTAIGLDDATGTFSMMYADHRGACRVYEMSLAGRVWRIWGRAPAFHQRFEATISPDGTTITGAWESSRDGTSWEHDFDVAYTRIA